MCRTLLYISTDNYFRDKDNKKKDMSAKKINKSENNGLILVMAPSFLVICLFFIIIQQPLLKKPATS